MTETTTIARFPRTAPSAASYPPRAPRRPLYHAGTAFGRFVFSVAMNVRQVRPEIPSRRGPFILAITHLSHLEPIISCVLIERRIEWMTRREFYKHRPIAWLLAALDCFMVNRQGVPVAAIREAIARLKNGRVVGICPEGGVTHGKDAAIHGGPIKRGVASASIRSGAPIIPCVMLGTHKLNKIRPWLPIKSGELYVAYGHPIHPPANTKSTRTTRQALADQLRQSYQDLYAELRAAYNLNDAEDP